LILNCKALLLKIDLPDLVRFIEMFWDLCNTSEAMADEWQSPAPQILPNLDCPGIAAVSNHWCATFGTGFNQS
jgi:hypothetical protein